MARHRCHAIAARCAERGCAFLLVLISLFQVATGTNALQNCDMKINILCRHQLKPNQDNVESLVNVVAIPSSTPSTVIPECTLDENGFYGDYWGFSAELDFYYEVSVNPGTKSSEVQDEIVPEVEKALVLKVLPYLFRATCGNGTQQRMLQVHSVRGVSVLPSDLIMDSVLCRETSAECFVVNAQITLYGENATSQLGTTKQDIVDLMKNGEFNQGVDNRIVSIWFSNYTGVDRVVSDPSQAPVVVTTGSATGMPVWGAVLIFITVFLACVVFCACPAPCGGDYDELGSNTSNFQRGQQLPLVQ